jgi:hypothetical protein
MDRRDKMDYQKLYDKLAEFSDELRKQLSTEVNDEKYQDIIFEINHTFDIIKNMEFREKIKGFALNQNASPIGTSLKGHIGIPPSKLVLKYGIPQTADNYKVSGEYIFEDSNGQVYTLFDYKETELYNSDYTPVETFWSSNEPYEFNIGSKSSDQTKIESFKNWLINQLSSIEKEETNVSNK